VQATLASVKSNPSEGPSAAGRRSLLAIYAILASASGALLGGAPDAATIDQPKTHTLFMGADFSVVQGKDYFLVHDVVGSSFVIAVNGRDREVSMKGPAIPMRIAARLKMTGVSAAVTGLTGERAYTPEHDPVMLFTRNVAHEADMNAQAQLSQSNIGHIYYTELWKEQSNHRTFGANPLASASMAAIVMADLKHKLEMTNVSVNQPEDNLADPFGHELFDAMEYRFELSSEKPLNNPFVVIVTRFHEKDAKPGLVGNQIYAQALDPIGPKPRRMDIIAGGLPPAFVLVDYQVHFYNRGDEIASNVAPDRVGLTREEAFQYLRMEFTASHKGKTLPPELLAGNAPADLRERLSLGQYSLTYYVRVSKAGEARQAFLDEACAKKVEDPYLTALLGAAWFDPALDKGVPVEGVAKIKLSQLLQREDI
jgi:hypothetical protein